MNADTNAKGKAMTSSDYLRRVGEILGAQGRGVVVPGGERPWGIRWLNANKDPFTGEPPLTLYFTSAEALRAANSLFDPYSPADFPQATEPVGVDATKQRGGRMAPAAG